MGNSGISCISQAAPPQGVLAHQASATDLLFITLRKSEALFSPTTRYNDYAKRGGVKLQFLCLGFTDYVSHEGERPMAIRWRLHRAIPAALYPELAVAVCASRFNPA